MVTTLSTESFKMVRRVLYAFCIKATLARSSGKKTTCPVDHRHEYQFLFFSIFIFYYSSALLDLSNLYIRTSSYLLVKAATYNPLSSVYR